MAYNPRDYFFKEAKKKDFAARSVFKLEEIDRRFRITQGARQALDLGASPGSWSQYLSKKLGPKGRILAIDLQPMKVRLQNVDFVQGSILDQDLLEQAMSEHEFKPPLDLVVSDMAPKTTGVKLQDQSRSHELCEMALTCAEKNLRPGGHFVCKIFQGPDFDLFKKTVRSKFDKLEILKPKSTRKESKEIFMVGLGFKQELTPE